MNLSLKLIIEMAKQRRNEQPRALDSRNLRDGIVSVRRKRALKCLFFTGRRQGEPGSFH